MSRRIAPPEARDEDRPPTVEAWASGNVAGMAVGTKGITAGLDVGKGSARAVPDRDRGLERDCNAVRAALKGLLNSVDLAARNVGSVADPDLRGIVDRAPSSARKAAGAVELLRRLAPRRAWCVRTVASISRRQVAARAVGRDLGRRGNVADRRVVRL